MRRGEKKEKDRKTALAMLGSLTSCVPTISRKKTNGGQRVKRSAPCEFGGVVSSVREERERGVGVAAANAADLGIGREKNRTPANSGKKRVEARAALPRRQERRKGERATRSIQAGGDVRKKNSPRGESSSPLCRLFVRERT